MNSNFTDGINFLSKLTPVKVLNVASVITSYFYSKIKRKAYHNGMPISLAFEPTTSCNLRCPECPSGLRAFTRPTGMLSVELFKKTIDQLDKKLLYLIFYFQGEPFLHHRFLELVTYASQKNIYTATSTNAHFLKDEIAKETVKSGLDRLIISIDGTTQKTYQAYRKGGQLDRVIEGTKNVIKWKQKLQSKTPHVIFQFLVMKPNEHQINEVKKLAKKLGVNEVGLKTAQINDFYHGSDLIPSNDNYSRYKINGDGTYSIKNRLLNHCWKMWNSCVITWDGKVVPCCFDKDATHVLGDVSRQPFEAIWKGKSYKQFRSSLLISRSKIEMCKNCTEGTRVWA